MRKKTLLLLHILFFNCCFALDFYVESTKQLAKDMSYSLLATSEFPLQAHIVTIPLDTLNMKLIPAIGQREEVAAIAKRCKAFCAINGSNYRRGGNYNGNRVNLLYNDNHIITDLQLSRGSFGWNSKSHEIIIDTIFLKSEFVINGMRFPVDSINQPRIKGKSTLYTHMTDIALLYHTPGTNIIINDKGVVYEVTETIPTAIPSHWYVYQVDKGRFPSVKKGMKTMIEFDLQSCVQPRKYNDFDFILEGAGLLIQNDKIITDRLYREFSKGKSIVHCNDEIAADFHSKEMQHWLIDERHPRTALGITKDNELCIAVIDGRQEQSQGVTLHELALLMYQLGCTTALNIGGGGCSTLYLENNVVNNPSAQAARPVSEALCFF